jgi:hypothetical protein
MQKRMLKRGVVLIVTVMAWVGWGTPQALAQRARVPQTGQTQCWDTAGALIPCAGTGQDGASQTGVPLPTPRFMDNRNGTVTDKLTGLIWLKDANCFSPGQGMFWADALRAARTLAAPQCGLTDGSITGDWRLPNVRELLSLVDYGFAQPALSNAAGTAQWTEGDPFTHVNNNYWTSTTYTVDSRFAVIVTMIDGLAPLVSKDVGAGLAWPVRGGD